MKKLTVTMKYVLCFIKKGDFILLIKRVKEPWKSKWNGVGGKLAPRESPKQAIYREVKEETGIELAMAKKVDFKGIVTWNSQVEADALQNNLYGMYVYVAEFSENSHILSADKETEEGLLGWKTISFAVDKNNSKVPDNMPHFLPKMLENKPPAQYHCNFDGDVFKSITIFKLAAEYIAR